MFAKLLKMEFRSTWNVLGILCLSLVGAGLLHDGYVTSVLVGASRPQQLLDNIGALKNTTFSDEELRRIDEISLR